MVDEMKEAHIYRLLRARYGVADPSIPSYLFFTVLILVLQLLLVTLRLEQVFDLNYFFVFIPYYLFYIVYFIRKVLLYDFLFFTYSLVSFSTTPNSPLSASSLKTPSSSLASSSSPPWSRLKTRRILLLACCAFSSLLLSNWFELYILFVFSSYCRFAPFLVGAGRPTSQ